MESAHEDRSTREELTEREAAKFVEVNAEISDGHAHMQRSISLLPEVLFIPDKSALHRVERDNIRYLRSEGKYVEVHTMDKRYVLRSSMRKLVQQLDDPRLQQVNRSTMVNILHLEKVDSDHLMVAGARITLSRNYRSALIERLRVLSGG